jgi:beta-lactamase class A
MLLISIWAKNPISAQTLKQTSIDQAMASLEIKMHGRIGFYAINTANDERFGYHAEERFP